MGYGPSRGYTPKQKRAAAMGAIKAPVIPTTNMRVPRPKMLPNSQPTQQPSPMFFGGSRPPGGFTGSSGIPSMTRDDMNQKKNGPTFTADSNPIITPLQHSPDPIETNGTRSVGGQDVFNAAYGGGIAADQIEHGQRPTGSAGTPIPSYTGNPEAQQSTDQMAENVIQELLGGGPRDTTDEEALIRELMQSQAGQGQVDLMAGMAAGGFGRSGAASAGMADIRTRAARSAADEIMGVRQGARDEWLDRVRTGLEAEFQDRGMDLSDEQWNQYMDMLDQINQDDPTAPVDADNNGIDDRTGESEDFDTKVVSPQVKAAAQVWDSGVPLLGAYEGSDGQFDYFRGIDGKYWKIPIQEG